MKLLLKAWGAGRTLIKYVTAHPIKCYLIYEFLRFAKEKTRLQFSLNDIPQWNALIEKTAPVREFVTTYKYDIIGAITVLLILIAAFLIINTTIKGIKYIINKYTR